MNSFQMKALWRNLKNIPGWKTDRKVIVFAVDDYGNVRVHSKMASQKMLSAGNRIYSRFDAFDALETREDLEMLYDVLTSVRDSNGHPALFTAFALPCNIDFLTMKMEKYREYRFELLPSTFLKLSSDNDAYVGAWDMWNEGVKNGLMVAEFHGREHINLRIFEERLEAKDQALMVMLENNSFTTILSSKYPSAIFSAAFEVCDFSDLEKFPQILRSGLIAFKDVFGRNADVFTPPVHRFPKSLEHTLSKHGLLALDKPFVAIEKSKLGTRMPAFRTIGYAAQNDIVQLVRNAVFEPTHMIGFDWVGSVLRDIEIAFKWNRPAIISSHRVNFCGHVDSGNRRIGLTALAELLKAIVSRWPDVEFHSAGTLTKLILQERRTPTS